MDCITRLGDWLAAKLSTPDLDTMSPRELANVPSDDLAKYIVRLRNDIRERDNKIAATRRNIIRAFLNA